MSKERKEQGQKNYYTIIEAYEDVSDKQLQDLIGVSLEEIEKYKQEEKQL